MRRSTIKAWFLIHKWSSLVCTLFLFLLCVTGLPLIFHDEIDAAFGEDYEATLTGPASAQDGVPLDTMLSLAVEQRPGEVPLFMAFSQDSPLLTITTGPTPNATESEMTLLFFDRATGESLGPAPSGGIMDLILDLHIDLLMGQWGMWFLGAMGVLFVVALVSGLVLYVPFMRRLAFGTLRLDRNERVGRLDSHNFFGVLILAWALVVGLTGVINAYADPLTESWRDGELARMTERYGDAAPVPPEAYGSLDAAMASAKAGLPNRSPQFIAFPGGAWSTGHHYAVFFQGDRPLTRDLLTPALIDAETSELVASAEMPVINQALMMSKPLHFGDYGGLPLKLIWAALDIATIYVLWTGILLWFRRRPGRIERRIEEIRRGGFSAASA